MLCHSFASLFFRHGQLNKYYAVQNVHQSHLFQLTCCGFELHTMQDLLNIHKNIMPPRCITNWKKYHKISVRTVMQKLLVSFSLFRQLKVRDIFSISCLLTTVIIFILNGYITFMAITHLEQYPDGNSVLVHHTVKKSVYSFVYLQDELKYTAYLADTNSTHLANSCWLDYSDCSIWFPFSGFYPQFGLIQRTMFYEQHKTIRFVVIQSTWKTGIIIIIIIKTSLPICINPFRMLSAAHSWVLYNTLSVTIGLFDRHPYQNCNTQFWGKCHACKLFFHMRMYKDCTSINLRFSPCIFLKSITFIGRLTHSIVWNSKVKIYVVSILKDN